jgi:hypothetical protein
LEYFAQQGYAKEFEILLSRFKYDLSLSEYASLILSSEHGYWNICQLILDKFDIPVEFLQKALGASIKNNQIHIVDFFMRNKCQCCVTTEALQIALQHNRYEIAKILLKDDRIDPSDNNNLSLRLACRQNNLEQ